MGVYVVYLGQTTTMVRFELLACAAPKLDYNPVAATMHWKYIPHWMAIGEAIATGLADIMVRVNMVLCIART